MKAEKQACTVYLMLPEEKALVQVSHITLHGKLYQLLMENFHYKTANKITNSISYHQFLWHIATNILGRLWPLFQNLKLPWDGSCLHPAQRPRAAKAITASPVCVEGQ